MGSSKYMVEYDDGINKSRLSYVTERVKNDTTIIGAILFFINFLNSAQMFGIEYERFCDGDMNLIQCL